MMTAHKKHNKPLIQKAKAVAIDYRSHLMLLIISGSALGVSLAYFIGREF